MGSVPFPGVARRPRGFVGVRGPDAATFLQRIVSNDVEGLAVGASCDALLLTPKARVIAPLRVLRRGEEDFLLLTEPELAATVGDRLLRFRFAAKVEIEIEAHDSHVFFGDEPPSGVCVPTPDYGVTAWEVVDVAPPADVASVSEEELELLRIEAGTPRYGLEIDERILPAEAGLVERAVSLTKGCYPGQEPIARLHYRGHANRGLRVLTLEGDRLPAYDAELRLSGKAVGRVTSAAALPGGGGLALAFVRREVPQDAVLDVAGDGIARPASPEVVRPA
jgi:tRNA-modifying protein YgfZ